MDDELLRHLRRMTYELRRFSGRLDDDFEQLIDGFDTILDGATARSRKPELPELSIAEGFLSQIPEWVVVYEKRASDRVVWYNAECGDLFKVPLSQALENRLRRRDLIVLSACTFGIGGRYGGYDEYEFPDHRHELGRPHAFEFYEGGVEYMADFTFKFDHYERQLTHGTYFLREERSDNPTARPNFSNQNLLCQVLEHAPIVAAVKKPDGLLEWCNQEFLRLVQRLSPLGERFEQRTDLYGKTSVQLFKLGTAQAQELTNIETDVADKKQAVIARDLIHGEKRLTLRFPIVDHSSKVKYIGVASM